MWLEKDGQPISFWHDIPLYPEKGNNRIVSYVVEIPRWTDGKIETRRDEPLSKTSLPRHSLLLTNYRPYLPRRQEGKASFCRECLAAQVIPVPLRIHSPDLGEPQL